MKPPSVMQAEVQRLIAQLGLKPHPEGGYYCERYRSAMQVTAGERRRSALTSIVYLLTAESFSAFHRIASDEMWHHYRGGAVTIETLEPNGTHGQIALGEGGHFQAVIPAGLWFAAHTAERESFALIGCDVAPGFDFEDFELASRSELLERFPQHRALVERWTRSG
jgi:predicted cupin superfamily sugar epimerase